MASHSRALIFDTKGNVLLGLEAHSQEYGLVGGHCKENEHPVDALLREIHEETKLGPNFRHLEYLRDYLDNSIFLVIVDPPPAIPDPSQDPDCEFLSFIWADPAHPPDNISEFASDVLFHYLCGLVGKVTASVQWSDYVKGEWWLTKNGSEFADIDAGDAGHEQIALQNLLGEHFDEFKEALDPNDKDKNLQETDDLVAYYWNEGKIPDDVGSKIMGPELWKDLKSDVRLAYAKHRGAILAIDFNFAAYKVTANTISTIQDHIYEQVSGSEISELEGDVTVVVEEYSTGKSSSLPVNDFLNIKNPGQLWRAVAGVIEVLVDGEKIGEFADDQVWETIPRLAQERARGKKVSFRQVLDSGEIVDMNLGVGLPGLSESAINDLESAIDEFRDHQADYVGYLKMTDSVAQDLRNDLERADRIPIYRCVSFDDKDLFLKGLQSHGTGIFWSFNPDKAVCYWGDKDNPFYAILTGIAGDSVDWLGTVEQHMRPSTAGEDEIRLLPHKSVQVKEVEIFERSTRESTVVPINKRLNTGSREQDRSEPPAQLSASLSLEGVILKIVNYYFENYFGVDCPQILVTTITTSEPWLAKTENSDKGIELIVNRAIAQVPKVLKQAVAHESIHIFLYSQGKFEDPHGSEFSKWAEIINSDEGPNYISKTANETSF